MSAAHYGLDNLTAIVDRNRLQIDGRTAEVMSLEPLPQKWQAFGWHTLEVDGHDIPQLLEALPDLPRASPAGPASSSPTPSRAKGCPSSKDKAKYHGTTPNDEEYRQALKELGG